MAESTSVPGIETNTPQFSESVPGVQFPFRQEFGKEGAAFEHLGEQVEGAAQEGGKIYEEIQRQHDISTASKAAIDTGVSHAQMLLNLKQTSPDGFVHDPDTNEIQTNADGSQRTIAQEYWDKADADYQKQQDGMSSQAAAMYRAKVQPEIADNTRHLQVAQMGLQHTDAELNLKASMDTLAHDNIRNPWSDTKPYYDDVRPDGSINLRGNTDKINDQLRTLTMTIAQRGPVDGKPGAYTPDQVAALTQKTLSDHADNWVKTAATNILEQDGVRDRKNTVSTTALQQVLNLRDVVQGKDPQSLAAAAKGLPTVNKSLTVEQVNSLSAQLDSMHGDAKEVDKSEYHLALQQLNESAKGVKSLDQFVNSPLFQHTLHSGEPLGMTPDERVKDIAGAFATAATNSAVSGTSGLASEESKRIAVNKVLQDASVKWPNFAASMGVKDVSGFGSAILAEATRQAESKLQENASAFKADPMKYAAGVEQGPAGPDGKPVYRQPMAHAVDATLSAHPEVGALFKPMQNGKSVFENAQQTANSVYARGFGASADVVALQKEQFQDQAKRLMNAQDPKMLTAYFDALSKQNVTAAQKETFLDQLHTKGGLPQTYIDVAKNLDSASEKEARFAALRAGSTQVQDYLKNQGNGGSESAKTIQALAFKNNTDLMRNLDLKYGPNNPELSKAKNQYLQSWQADYANARARGLGPSDAADQANQARQKTTAGWGTVGAQHNFLGMSFGTSGPQVPVEYGVKRSDAEKQVINTNLLHAQSVEELSKYKFASVPNQSPANPNAPSQAQWVAAHAAMWSRENGVFRLRMQETDAQLRPTGRTIPVEVVGADGKNRYIEVQDRDALAAHPEYKQAVKPKASSQAAVPGLYNQGAK